MAPAALIDTAVPDLRRVSLADVPELDGDVLDDALRRLLAPLGVPVAAFNSSI